MQQPPTLMFGAPSNDNASLGAPDRILDVANEMIEDLPFEGQWRLQGFSEGLRRLDPERHGFGVDDIKRVVLAWEGYDGAAWDGGFVVNLRDGRRARFYCLAVAYDWEREGEVTVSFVPADYDERGANEPWGDFHVFETELPELQEYLRRLAVAHCPF